MAFTPYPVAIDVKQRLGHGMQLDIPVFAGAFTPTEVNSAWPAIENNIVQFGGCPDSDALIYDKELQVQRGEPRCFARRSKFLIVRFVMVV